MFVYPGGHEPLGDHRAFAPATAVLLRATVMRPVQYHGTRGQIVYVSLVDQLRSASRRESVINYWFHG